MQNVNLTTVYLAKLSNAEHDGITAQINERLSEFTTDNPLLVTAITALQEARQAESVAFKRFSGKDFASDDLKKEDWLQDQYMSAIRAILNGLTLLPETEPIQRRANETLQVFKDFQFSSRDGYEAEARKTVNMVQEWNKTDKYDLDALGIKTWVAKANEQANKVLQLVQVRVDHTTARVKGELADARKATDAAFRKVVDVLNVLNSLQPSEAISELITKLAGIESRARQYYLPSSKTSTSTDVDA